MSFIDEVAKERKKQLGTTDKSYDPSKRLVKAEKYTPKKEKSKTPKRETKKEKKETPKRENRSNMKYGLNREERTLDRNANTLRNRESLYTSGEKDKVQRNATLEKKRKEARASDYQYVKSIAPIELRATFGNQKTREEAEKELRQKQIERRAEVGYIPSDKFGAAYVGLAEGLTNASLPGVIYSIATGNKLFDTEQLKGTDLDIIANPTVEPLQKSKSAGNTIGTFASYGMSYGAAGKTKAFGDVTDKIIGSKGVTKAAETLSRKIGQEASQNLVRGLTRSAVGDATVGTVTDLGIAMGEGKKGKELAKDMGINAALNIGIGGAMEIAPVAMKKILGNTSVGKAVSNAPIGTNAITKEAENVVKENSITRGTSIDRPRIARNGEMDTDGLRKPDRRYARETFRETSVEPQNKPVVEDVKPKVESTQAPQKAVENGRENPYKPEDKMYFPYKSTSKNPADYKYEVVSVMSDDSVSHTFYNSKKEAEKHYQNANGLTDSAELVDLSKGESVGDAIERIRQRNADFKAETEKAYGGAENLERLRAEASEYSRQQQESTNPVKAENPVETKGETINEEVIGNKGKVGENAKESRTQASEKPNAKRRFKSKALKNKRDAQNFLKDTQEEYDNLYEKAVEDVKTGIYGYEKKGSRFEDSFRKKEGSYYEGYTEQEARQRIAEMGEGDTVVLKSDNEPWYREMYRRYNGNLSKKNVDEFAREMLDRELAGRGNTQWIDPDGYLKALHDIRNEARNVVDEDFTEDILASIAGTTPEPKLRKAKGTFREIENVGSKAETPDLPTSKQKNPASDEVKNIADDFKSNDTITSELPKNETPKKVPKTKEAPKTPEKIGNFEVETSPKAKAETESIVEAGSGLLKKARGLYQKLVSGQAPIERMAKKAEDKKLTADLTSVRNSRSTTNYIVSDGLVGKDGKKLVKGTKADGTKEYFGSYADLFKKMSKEDLADFNTYATHLHNIDRWVQDKPVFKQTTSEESQQIAKEMLEKHPEFAQKSKDINEWWNAFVDEWLVKSGRLSKEAAEEMRKKYPNYVPTYRVEEGSRFINATDSMGNRVSGTSGIKSAKGGTSEVIPVEDQFLWYIDRIVEGTRKNELYADFVNTIKDDPKKFAEYGILSKDKNTLSETFDSLMDNLEKSNIEESKSGKFTLTAYVDGKPVTAQVSKEVAEAIRLLDNPYGNDYMKWFASVGKPVTNLMKTGITGLNPIFALTNAMRDFSTILVQSEHGIGKTLTGMGKAISNIAKDSELWEMYKAGGGKNSGYFAQGKGFKEVTKADSIPKKTWKMVTDVLGALGETTESVPRFAEFLNTYEKLGGGEEAFKKALNSAAEVTVDFSRSAPMTKAADGWVLYLNAAVQGLDKFARTAAEHPVRTLGRSAALITAPYAILMAKNWNNPYYQDLSDRTKQMYYCIPNVMGEFDENGNAKTFIKIPINREYGAVMGSSLDMFMKMFEGQENPGKQYRNTLATNFLPPDAASDNFLTPLLYNVRDDVNVDFAGRAIVPSALSKLSPQYQFDSSTSGVAKGVSKAVNFLDEKGLPMPNVLKSPKKVDYLIDSYAGFFGDVAQGITAQDKKKPDFKNANSILDYVAEAFDSSVTKDLLVQKFTADPRFSSQAVATFYDDLDKVTVAKNDAEHLGNGQGKERIIYNAYNSVSNQLRDSYKAEKEIINDTSLTPKQREEKIKQLRQERNEIANSAKDIAESIGKETEKAVEDFKKNVDFTGMTEDEKDSKIYAYIKSVAENVVDEYNVKSGNKTWDDVAEEKLSKSQRTRMEENGAKAEDVMKIKNYYASLGMNASSEGMELYEAGKKGGFSEATMKAFSNRVTDSKINASKNMTPEQKEALESSQETKEKYGQNGNTSNAQVAVAMFYDGKSGKEIMSAISEPGASKASINRKKKTVKGAYMVASTGWDLDEYDKFYKEAKGDNGFVSQTEADAWFKNHPEYTKEQAYAASYLATGANKYLLP